MTDNRRHLLEAAAASHLNAVAKARRALRELDRSGQPITFHAVAKAAGVSRSWLYRDADMRGEIERLRAATASPAGLPAAQRATADSIRQQRDALNAELTRARQEIRDLREQLARQLGEQRTTATWSRR